ncbi:MAG: glycoside hydrolase family 3 C-terminal domain-containing protein [Bacteroidales bacterium]|nr:glycoside hydrolase family 3 C-terminal domain-containing protein [Bacteroidales bacterium]
MKRFSPGAILPLLIFASILAFFSSCSKADWKDPSLTPADRAQALLKQMTLEEKIGQMCQYVGPCYVPPGQGTAHGNVDAEDENLGHPDMAQKIREGRVGAFLHVLTVEEAAGLQKIALQSRLGIPLLLGIDAIHGNGLIEGCTIYPTDINMASTFHPELMERIGAETAQEMRQCGVGWTFAPNLDVARDARWGRMGETFGEDPYLVSEMGKYYIWGFQGRDRNFADGHVLACAKHLIAGGEPFGGLNAAPMDLSERELREIYLPPFEVAIKEADVATVMTAHNEINGIPCHGNAWLVQTLLKDELGFDGVVVSDWMDIERMHLYHKWLPSVEEAFRVSVETGIDIHMQGDGYLETILEAVRGGRIPESRIDEAAGKILEAKFALGLFENPVPVVGEPLRDLEAHRQTALECAREGLVLLKNDGILPLQPSGFDAAAYPSATGKGTPVRRIFVCGPNADSQTILGDWVVPQPEENVTTILEGIRAMAPDATVEAQCFNGRIFDIDDAGIRAARASAARADVNILVLGENSQRYSAFGTTCGENRDRDDINLAGRQQELMEAVVAAGKPVVLVLTTGRALSIGWAQERVNAILNAWEAGMAAGQAVGEVLFGLINPSGKLPVTFPRSVGQIPTVYNYRPMQYSRQFAIGPTGALYPFGFGLSYTSFEYGKPAFEAVADAGDSAAASDTLTVRAGDRAAMTFTLANTGEMDGTEVVQLYIRHNYAPVTRPVKELKGFQRIALKAGESATVRFEITPEMLSMYDAPKDAKTFPGLVGSRRVLPGDYTLMVGSSSANADLQRLILRVE